MNKSFSHSRKIDPTKGSLLADGSPNNNDRIEIGPSQLAFNEWEQANLICPNLTKMREYRHKRLTEHVVARNLAGLLMFDPLNIRYATDTTNMQLWNSHNPFRACFISPDGYVILWDYKALNLLSSFNPLVKEVRNSASM